MALASPYPNEMEIDKNGEPKLRRSYALKFVGDWGGANFHRICAWLTQEFCDRAGPGSRTSITSLRDGGLDGVLQLNTGEADLAICTPTALVSKSIKGEAPGLFPTPMPHLRAIGTLPQNDRMVFALDPKFNITSFQQLKDQRPALRLVTSVNDGTNCIGYVADAFLNAHGISRETIESWGGSVSYRHRPEQCVALVEEGKADALLQEAIMTPWWRRLVEADKLVPLAAQQAALDSLYRSLGLPTNPLPAGWWPNLTRELPALDFSDFVVLVRDDMPDEVAFLLTWSLVETKHMIEGQYAHISADKSPLNYPMQPEKMAKTPVPLHEGARRYYEEWRSKAALNGKRKTVVSPFSSR